MNKLENLLDRVYNEINNIERDLSDARMVARILMYNWINSTPTSCDDRQFKKDFLKKYPWLKGYDK
jgi:hypothetical protein